MAGHPRRGSLQIPSPRATTPWRIGLPYCSRSSARNSDTPGSVLMTMADAGRCTLGSCRSFLGFSGSLSYGYFPLHAVRLVPIPIAPLE